MKAIILQSSKSATQSGESNRGWTLQFEEDKTKRYVENYMAWTACSDPSSQVSISFETLKEAVSFAGTNGIEYEIIESPRKKLRPKSYTNNFS